MSRYKLISTKGTRTVDGDFASAIYAALAMEEELQPAYGVTVEDAQGNTVAEARDGVIAVETDDDEGLVHLESAAEFPAQGGDSVFVAWASGVSTWTPTSLLRAA